MAQEDRDLLESRRVVMLAFVLPALALVASGFFRVDSRMEAVVWASALIVMGSTCARNAWGCGRLHCYFTAPFLYCMAAAALIVGFSSIRRSPMAWNALAAVLVVGVLTLTWLPERIFGRYRRREPLP